MNPQAEIDFVKHILPACITSTTIRLVEMSRHENDHSHLLKENIAEKSVELADAMVLAFLGYQERIEA